MGPERGNDIPFPAHIQPTASCWVSCPNRTQPHRHSSMERVCSSPGKCTWPRPPTGAHTGPVHGFQAAHCATSSRHPHIAGSVTLTQCRAARHSLLFSAHSLPLPSAQHGCAGGHRVSAWCKGCRGGPGMRGSTVQCRAWQASCSRSSFAVTHPGNPHSSQAGCPGPLLPRSKAMQESTNSTGCLPPHLPDPTALALQWDWELAPALGFHVPLCIPLPPKQLLPSTRVGVTGAIGCQMKQRVKLFGV